jgi:hypothetical protein
MVIYRFGPWQIRPTEHTDGWEATHDDYGASWEGEEDGWISNGLHTSADTIPNLLEEIAELERDKGRDVTFTSRLLEVPAA